MRAVVQLDVAISFLAILAVKRHQVVTNLLYTGGRSQGIPPVRSRSNVPGGTISSLICSVWKVLEQRWHIVKNAVFLEGVGLDQFLEISETADIHTNLDSGIERSEPPRFLVGARGHPECAQPSRVNLGAAGQAVERAKLIEHHHPEQYLPPPEHQLEGILFARLTIGFLLALLVLPSMRRKLRRDLCTPPHLASDR